MMGWVALALHLGSAYACAAPCSVTWNAPSTTSTLLPEGIFWEREFSERREEMRFSRVAVLEEAEAEAGMLKTRTSSSFFAAQGVHPAQAEPPMAQSSWRCLLSTRVFLFLSSGAVDTDGRGSHRPLPLVASCQSLLFPPSAQSTVYRTEWCIHWSATYRVDAVFAHIGAARGRAVGAVERLARERGQRRRKRAARQEHNSGRGKETPERHLCECERGWGGNERERDGWGRRREGER